MGTVAELKAEIDALQKRLKEAEKAEQSDAIKKVVEICKTHGISYAQLKPHLTKQRKPRKQAAADASEAV